MVYSNIIPCVGDGWNDIKQCDAGELVKSDETFMLL